MREPDINGTCKDCGQNGRTVKIWGTSVEERRICRSCADAMLSDAEKLTGVKAETFKLSSGRIASRCITIRGIVVLCVNG